MTPYLGGCNFLASNPFLLIFNATNAPRRGLHLIFGHHKQWGLPPEMVNKPYLNCSDSILLTLVYNFLLITGHLGNTYVENLNMTKKNFFLKNDDFFFQKFKKILHANHRSFFMHFHQKKFNFRF
jgi:hypothetical protein